MPGGEVLGILSDGTHIEVLEQSGEWLKARYSGQDGFVAAAYVTFDAAEPAAESGEVRTSDECRFEGNRAVAPDGTVFATRRGVGVMNIGTTRLATFIKAHAGDLFPPSCIKPSLVSVMQAVSENEGLLEAINTYDNAFLSFGVFQWTVGAGDGRGELAALLALLKTEDNAAFDRCFGRFGLDVAELNAPAGVVPTGYLSLAGKPLRTAAEKEQLRTLDWAYRFWLAGQNTAVRRAEVLHAAGRIDTFYGIERAALGGRALNALVNSEYGVALLLDQHVNRPAHVVTTVAGALARLPDAIADKPPPDWTTADEEALLAEYVAVRAGTGMTASDLRARRTRDAVASGACSAERGSFKT
jgi:hypothetical protein